MDCIAINLRGWGIYAFELSLYVKNIKTGACVAAKLINITNFVGNNDITGH